MGYLVLSMENLHTCNFVRFSIHRRVSCAVHIVLYLRGFPSVRRAGALWSTSDYMHDYIIFLLRQKVHSTLEAFAPSWRTLQFLLLLLSTIVNIFLRSMKLTYESPFFYLMHSQMYIQSIHVAFEHKCLTL